MYQHLKRLCLLSLCVLFGGATACADTPTAADPLYPPAETIYSLGEGDTRLSFSVIGPDGAETSFLISTDADIVGEALGEVGLLAGEAGPFGLMVTTVNGQTLLYEDGAYWAFFIDGEYAMTGVDQTQIEEDVSYSFRAEAA